MMLRRTTWNADEGDVNHEELACVKNAWQQATRRANEAQELWGERVHYQLEKGFAKVVRVRETSPLAPVPCSSVR